MLLPNLLRKRIAPDPLLLRGARLDVPAAPQLRRRARDVRLGAAAGREAVLDVLHPARREEVGDGVHVGVLEGRETCFCEGGEPGALVKGVREKMVGSGVGRRGGEGRGGKGWDAKGKGKGKEREGERGEVPIRAPRPRIFRRCTW